MIFQLSDWFPKPIMCAIIVKFDQIRKNGWRISCAEILEVGKNFFAASSVKKMSRFEEVSPEKIKRIAWKFTKTVILLGLAGYELIITNSAYGLVGYIYQLISGASSNNNCLLLLLEVVSLLLTFARYHSHRDIQLIARTTGVIVCSTKRPLPSCLVRCAATAVV